MYYGFDRVFGAGNTDLSGISDLEILNIGEARFLYAYSAATGAVTALRLQEGSPAVVVSQVDQENGEDAGGVSRIGLAKAGGQDLLIGSGSAFGRVDLYEIGTGGTIESVLTLDGTAAPAARLDTQFVVQTAGESWLFARHWGQSGLYRYEIAADLSLGPAQWSPDGSDRYLGDVTAITGIEHGGQAFVFAASGADAGVSAFRLDPGGALTHQDSLGAGPDLPVSAPSAIEAVSLGGKVFTILGSAGSSSLTVLGTGPGGTLRMESHLIDTSGTRFQNVTALETVSVNGRVIVFAGGADDGFTMLELGPEGRLYEITSFRDKAGVSLADVAALSATAVGEEVQLYVSSVTEPGLTRFHVGLGAFGELLEGSDGADSLSGGAEGDFVAGLDGNDILSGGGGDDRISGGAGADTMTGGAGRDIFVFRADGSANTVTDFVQGQDRLDLTDFPMLHGMDRLVIEDRPFGVAITHGDELIRLQTGGELAAADLTADDFIF